MAANDDVHVVFNFFEKISKPPEQESYVDGMKYIYEYVRKHASFVLGQLHQNMDPRGHYPYVNFAGFNNGDFPAFQRGKPSDEWLEVLGKGIGPPELRVSYPGGYSELATSTGEALCTTPPKGDTSCYLLLNYKEADVGEANFAAFEADWKTKFGATILTDTLSSDVKHGDIGLYKRLRPGISPFLYVLRCEILPGASVDKVLAVLPTLREKLQAASVPFTNVSAYKICYLCTPKRE